ncbi:MAG: hypothetical protein JRJ10_15275 [Deltaproteobacteria bacterium]|nr:hypothetical protein [Deltaproteobacteria bacterium]
MSRIRHLLVLAVSFGALMDFGGFVTSSASAQGSSLARSDRASTISSVPADVVVVLAKEEPGKIAAKASVQFVPLDEGLVPAEAEAGSR